MAKIIDFNFHTTDVQLFMDEITPVQMETISGGYCQSCSTYSEIYVRTFRKGINKVKKTVEGTGSTKDKNINSIDNSKRTYINGLLVEKKS
ncbi:hypothetical protein [Nostoc sp. MG11]|uniref:hypothetical protein n=1 Tax=Nostoc sp. MG11 TaxID=2721166 RepID=UPI0018660E91|nr:hypothetical protein [Nostoc sp. MG11]